MLAPRFSVLAIDKKSQSGEMGFHKPCGGLLAPDAGRSLARLGLSLPRELFVNPQTFAVRVSDLGIGQVRHYHRHYLNLDRQALDLWLRSLIPPQVTLEADATCTGISPIPGAYHIFWKREQKSHQAEARVVVGADGATSLIRKILYPQHKPRFSMAIQQWFAGEAPQHFYSCIFDRSITDCYAWSLSKGDYFILGGAFAPRGARAAFAALKKKVASPSLRLEQPVRTEACLVRRPQGLADICCGKQGVFLLGEAAGFISPSSLEGLSFALDSARVLSRVLNSKTLNPHRAYVLQTAGLRLKVLLKVGKAACLHSPAIRSLILRSGLGTTAMEPC
jgi:flavin-dependent dehydrogenase